MNSGDSFESDCTKLNTLSMSKCYVLYVYDDLCSLHDLYGFEADIEGSQLRIVHGHICGHIAPQIRQP
jgi:hypothetical protein